jgi:hypothetical protein
MTRKVSTLGVQLRDDFFTDWRLARWIRRKVQIEPLAETQVQVFDLRGKPICIATRHRDLTPKQMLEIVLTRASLRREDRKRFRRLLTQIEVDGREGALARAATSLATDESLVDALFGRLRTELNKPVGQRIPARHPHTPLDSEERRQTPTTAPTEEASSLGQDRAFVLNRPAPPRTPPT